MPLSVPVFALAVALLVPPAPARAEEAASGIIDRSRIAVIDGDSILIDGREWRLMGFDTPEFVDAKCEGEHRAGLFARRRLIELIVAAEVIEVRFSGTIDRNKRALGELILDGRNVSEPMIEEGYARAYTGGKAKAWCAASTRHDLPPDLELKQPLPAPTGRKPL